MFGLSCSSAPAPDAIRRDTEDTKNLALLPKRLELDPGKLSVLRPATIPSIFDFTAEYDKETVHIRKFGKAKDLRAEIEATVKARRLRVVPIKGWLPQGDQLFLLYKLPPNCVHRLEAAVTAASQLPEAYRNDTGRFALYLDRQLVQLMNGLDELRIRRTPLNKGVLVTNVWELYLVVGDILPLASTDIGTFCSVLLFVLLFFCKHAAFADCVCYSD